MQLTIGQTTNQGSLIGRVTDPNGNVIPAAQIVVSNLETGASRTVVTNQSGDYRLDFLPPCRYMITAEAKGFKSTTVTNVVVHVGQAQRIDAQLEVGNILEGVIVTAEGGIGINTETPTLGDVINERSIQNLPLNGREFFALAALVPGANTGNQNYRT